MAKRGRRNHRNTEGRRLLSAYLNSHPQTQLADALGLGQQAISAWKTGRARPGTHHREALKRLAGIPVEAWYSPDELAIARGRVAATPARRTGTDG